jgi:aurora kinase, other
MQEQLVRELKIQMFINHPNVVKVYGFFDDLLHFYTIMECALDGHLSDHLLRRSVLLKEDEAAALLYQTCSAVAALHTHSVIHRDLKPENLLMHEVNAF